MGSVQGSATAAVTNLGRRKKWTPDSPLINERGIRALHPRRQIAVLSKMCTTINLCFKARWFGFQSSLLGNQRAARSKQASLLLWRMNTLGTILPHGLSFPSVNSNMGKELGTPFSCRAGFSLWELLKLSKATWKHSNFSLPWKTAINFCFVFHWKISACGREKNRKTNTENKTENLYFRCLLLSFFLNFWSKIKPKQLYL